MVTCASRPRINQLTVAGLVLCAHPRAGAQGQPARDSRRLHYLKGRSHWNQVQYSPEMRERPVRLFQEHVHDHLFRWAAMQSIASKIGCTTQTLSSCVQPCLYDEGS